MSENPLIGTFEHEGNVYCTWCGIDQRSKEKIAKLEAELAEANSKIRGITHKRLKDLRLYCMKCLAELDKPTRELADRVTSLEAAIVEYRKALENIKTVTAKGNKVFSSLVDGALKMNELDLINHAKDGDALASLVYRFTDKALKLSDGSKLMEAVGKVEELLDNIRILTTEIMIGKKAGEALTLLRDFVKK